MINKFNHIFCKICLYLCIYRHLRIIFSYSKVNIGIMKEVFLVSNNEESNNYKLIVTKTVDRKDLNYYPNSPIVLTITLRNNSEQLLENLLIQDNIPEEIIPQEGNEFKVETSLGSIKQKNNQIDIFVEKLEANQELKIDIFGRIGKI